VTARQGKFIFVTTVSTSRWYKSFGFSAPWWYDVSSSLILFQLKTEKAFMQIKQILVVRNWEK